MTIQTRHRVSSKTPGRSAPNTHIAKHQHKPAAKRKEPILKSLQRDTLAQPKVKTKQLEQFQRAIDDHRKSNPYAFIVVKGTSAGAFYQLERIVSADPETRSSRSARLEESSCDAVFQAELKKICSQLRRLGERRPAVLQLFWDADEEAQSPQKPSDILAMMFGGDKSKTTAPATAAKSGDENLDDEDDADAAEARCGSVQEPSASPGGTEAWAERLEQVYAAIALAAPDTRLIVYTPQPSLDAASKAKKYEVYDARLLGWNAEEDGFALRAAHLSQKHALQLPAAQLKGALRQAPFKQLGDIFDYAKVLGVRHHDATPLDSLRVAARNFHDRGEDGKAYDNIVACVVDTQGCGQKRCGLEAPQGLLEFTDVLRHFSTYQSVYTNASKSMMFVGEDRAAKIALLKDLAADTNALLVVPPTGDLLAMIDMESDEEFEGFLNNATAHANACGRSAIVYLGELDALLALGEKAEGTLGFNLVAAQLTKLCDKAGRAPGWEDLVMILGTRESVEYTCEPLANIAFQAKTTTVTATQLAGVLRSSLAQAHPAHALTDEEFERVAHMCLRTKSPFRVDDVEQVLQHAARIAFRERQAGHNPSITKSHITKALEGIHAKVLDPTQFFYT